MAMAKTANMRGSRFMFAFAAAVAVMALIGFFALREASHLRFAISIHAIPESPMFDVVPLQRPILVRVDKRSAGRSPLTALAMLLDANGAVVQGVQPLEVKTAPSGKRSEEVVFPPLTELPGQRILAAAVLRLPKDTPEARARIEEAQRLGQERGGKLPRVFSFILAACKELGGHAELTQVEVRERI